jgi:hypothetical protein
MQQADGVAAGAAQLVRPLSTDKPGEAHAALGALKRALAAVGLDLQRFAQLVETSLERPPSPDDWRRRSWFCHRRRCRLSKRDAAFVDTVLRNFATNSDKQVAWLNDIDARLRGERRS